MYTSGSPTGVQSMGCIRPETFFSSQFSKILPMFCQCLKVVKSPLKPGFLESPYIFEVLYQHQNYLLTRQHPGNVEQRMLPLLDGGCALQVVSVLNTLCGQIPGQLHSLILPVWKTEKSSRIQNLSLEFRIYRWLKSLKMCLFSLNSYLEIFNKSEKSINIF